MPKPRLPSKNPSMDFLVESEICRQISGVLSRASMRFCMQIKKEEERVIFKHFSFFKNETQQKRKKLDLSGGTQEKSKERGTAPKKIRPWIFLGIAESLRNSACY